LEDERRENPVTALRYLATLLAIVIALQNSDSLAAQVAGDAQPQKKLEAAPEFPAGLEWLNTDRPLTLRELRGKVVLLDFWTYCCINCMHVIPDLKRLEAKYANELVVIGVHSAKFTTEKETDNIRQAILRYEVHHPVVNDRDFRVFNAYDAQAWPTFVLIDTEGRIIGKRSGEGIFGPADQAIGELVAQAEAKGTLNRKPLELRLEKAKARQSVLSFPGKVLADAASNRLFIADSNHNRIVVVSLSDGSVIAAIGGMDAGLADGDFEQARFKHPQGLALDGNSLYVADTENHAVRRVDLRKRMVETLAGTGKQAETKNAAGTGTSVALNSPWDLVIREGALYVAMAGAHQIWRIDLATARSEPFAGSGREDRIDGSRAEAALAQPSGLALDRQRLFVADSEVSAVRAITLDAAGRVETVVGEALFEFGDVDGEGTKVRLQHPLGVAWHDGALFVADTYNDKIKRVDPAKRESRTIAGSESSGLVDGSARSARFDEPGGLSYANGRLYIADTNNHVIRILDLATSKVTTLVLTGLDLLVRKSTVDGSFGGRVVQLAEQRVEPGARSVSLDVKLPQGYKLNTLAPFYAGLRSDDPNVVSVPAESSGRTTQDPKLPINLAIDARKGRTVLSVDAVIYYCEAARESVCLVKPVRLRVPLVVEHGAQTAVRIEYLVE
jgi:thiol-disulfide isomerase/thioredoxin